MFEKNTEQILSDFDIASEDYNSFLDYIERTIRSLLDGQGLQFHKIESRIKNRESLKKKIEVKDKYTSLSEITDVCGLRIITFFSDDVDKIADLLEKEFMLDDENSIDKRKSQDPTKFGYVSLHYILKLRENRANLSENNKYKDFKFEVQIRTILQHAWAEIEHDFGYKTESDVPEKIRRRFSRLAGIIELADDEFMQIKKSEIDYRNELEEYLNDETADTKGDDSQKTYIDSVSISALLESASFMEYLNEFYSNKGIEVRSPGGKYKDERISKIVKYCEDLEIKTIDELVNKFRNDFPDYFNNWIKDKTNYFYTWNVTPLLDVLTSLKNNNI